jgi:D-3-phosphoglycerate dehydrogenase / 2-oxoglutarate reductase
MAQRILVTPRSVTQKGHPSLGRFTDAGYEVILSRPGIQPSEAELLDLLPGCVGLLAGVEPISAKVLEAAKDLKVIGRNGVGVDNIDLEAAARLNITICPAIGSNSRGVAELAIGLALAMARSIPFSDAALKAGRSERRRGFEVEGKTLGLMGCGHIGRLVTRMALALGMKVVAFDPVQDASFHPGTGFRYARYEEVLATSDVISLHCPTPKDGRPLIDAEAISRMKKGVRLINTARSSLVDEKALLAALESGAVSMLAMDVFEDPPGANPLIKHDRVIATPHIGGFTDESIDRAVDTAVRLMLDCLQGKAGECGG